MNNTVYEINGTTTKIAAAYDLVFGWTIIVGNSAPQPLKYGHHFDWADLDDLIRLFAGPVYPEELKQALRDAQNKFDVEQEAARASEHLADLARQARMRKAEANAVSPMEEELQKLKRDHKVALSRLAIAYLRCELSKQLVGSKAHARIQCIISYAMDLCFNFEVRQVQDNGFFLSHKDCQVTVNRPTDSVLAEIVEGYLPFTK